MYDAGPHAGSPAQFQHNHQHYQTHHQMSQLQTSQNMSSPPSGTSGSSPVPPQQQQQQQLIHGGVSMGGIGPGLIMSPPPGPSIQQQQQQAAAAHLANFLNNTSVDTSIISGTQAAMVDSLYASNYAVLPATPPMASNTMPSGGLNGSLNLQSGSNTLGPYPNLPRPRIMKFEQFIKNNSVVLRPSYLGVACECTPVTNFASNQPQPTQQSQQQVSAPLQAPVQHQQSGLNLLNPNNPSTPFLSSGNTSLLAVCGEELYPGSSIKRVPGSMAGPNAADLELLRSSHSSTTVAVTQCCGMRCYGCNCSNLTISRIICWSIIVVICVTFVAVMVHVSLIIFTPPKPDQGSYYTGA